MRQDLFTLISYMVISGACITNSFAQEKVSQSISGDSILSKKKILLTDTKKSILSQINVPEEAKLFSPLKEKIAIFKPVTTLFKSGSALFSVRAMHADINYSYINDPIGISNGLMKGLNGTAGYDLGLQLSIANVPFDLRIAGNDGYYKFNTSPITGFPKFNFNHKEYVELIKESTLKNIKPELVLSNVLGKIKNVRGQYEKALKLEILKIKQEYDVKFKDKLDVPSNLYDLEVNDLSSIRTILVNSEVSNDYRKGMEVIQQSLSVPESTTGEPDSIKQSAISRVEKLVALERIIERLKFYKSRYEDNPLVRELKEHLPFTPSNYSSYLNKPGNLSEVLREQSNLSGLQRLLLNLTKLDLGANPVSTGEFDIQGIMNSGLNTEFTGKHSSLGFITGSGTPNINRWLQGGLNSFVSGEYSGLMGMKLGSGWNSNFQQTVSVNFFDFNASRDQINNDPSLLQSAFISAPARRDAVITWQSSVMLTPNHKLEVDLSRSFGSYRNSLGEDSSLNKSNAFSELIGDEGKSNYAASIEYKGNVKNTDLQLSLRKAGLGYNNPGNFFIRRGETRIGVGVGRKFLKQKLSIRYKTDYRSQHFDPAKAFTYNNFSNNLQLGYRLNRNNRFGVILRHNSYSFNNNLISPTTDGFSLSLQSNANYIFRIEGNKLINYSSITRQNLDMPMINGENYASKTWLISHSSSMMIKKNILTMTLVLNESTSKDYYFNTSFFNSEISLAYQLGQVCRLTSGVGFYSNAGWNKQVGMNHQLSATLFNKIELAIDVSIKKAVQVERKELSDQAFISSSINYRF